MRKVILALVVLALVLGSLIGCSSSDIVSLEGWTEDDSMVVVFDEYQFDVSDLSRGATIVSAELRSRGWAEGGPVVMRDVTAEVRTTLDEVYVPRDPWLLWIAGIWALIVLLEVLKASRRRVKIEDEATKSD